MPAVRYPSLAWRALWPGLFPPDQRPFPRGRPATGPGWQFCLAGIVGGGVWSVPFAIADSKPTR